MPPRLFIISGPNYIGDAWNRMMFQTPSALSSVPIINFNAPERLPEEAVALAPAIPWLLGTAAAAGAAVRNYINPEEIYMPTGNISYYLHKGTDWVSNLFKNLLSSGYYAPARDLNVNEIYSRPVEVNDATYVAPQLLFGRSTLPKGFKKRGDVVTLPNGTRVDSKDVKESNDTTFVKGHGGFDKRGVKITDNDTPNQGNSSTQSPSGGNSNNQNNNSNSQNNSNNSDPNKKPFWKTGWGKAAKWGIVAEASDYAFPTLERVTWGLGPGHSKWDIPLSSGWISKGSNWKDIKYFDEASNSDVIINKSNSGYNLIYLQLIDLGFTDNDIYGGTLMRTKDNKYQLKTTLQDKTEKVESPKVESTKIETSTLKVNPDSVVSKSTLERYRKK